MLADALVFTVDGEQYRWRDVILSAVRRGEWDATELRARQGYACVKNAEARGLALPDGSLDAAGRDFRYAHDLVTAQSMEDWLHRHDLSVQEWTAYLRRELTRARTPGDHAPLVARYPLSDDDAVRLALIEAMCGGQLDRWARELAQRAAAHASMLERDESPAVTGDTGQAPLHPALRAVLGDDDAIRASAHRLARIDASLGAFRGALLTERAVADFLSGRQLDWVRFDCRLMSFPDEGQAAEAALLLREDGEGFTSVYQVAHTAPRGATFYLDEIDASMKDHFLGARRGDLIGPVHIDDEYLLYQIEDKVLPSLRDDDVRHRAERGVLSAAMGQQFDRRVVWQEAR